METMVDGAVGVALRDGGTEMIRLYVAACSERMAPLFIGMRAGAAGREADVHFYVESVRDLWFADRPLADAAERVRLLDLFPELEPTEEGITDPADTYAFFAVLVLRYALLANGAGHDDQTDVLERRLSGLRRAQSQQPGVGARYDPPRPTANSARNPRC
ncbi:hypothetical protein ABZW02_34935 [Streptomyces sp. NPDC005180]|uniref:hypothetical protein n=1 Tax=Streptomyces sp. NPDC005180 TaxID=3156868 RepID=UPI0033BF7CD4